jgi:hypothetical protein
MHEVDALADVACTTSHPVYGTARRRVSLPSPGAGVLWKHE